MLQQTTVPAVVPYFERWLEVFPDVRALAEAPPQRVLREWQGLGYYQRARNLHAAAQRVVRDHGGEVPAEAALLRRLPGFGPYTTAAVLSLAYGRPLPVVEANVRRVLMRVLELKGQAAPRVDKALLAFLGTVFPRRAAGDFNQALMELGALVCRPRSPQCLACPIRIHCRAEREGTQETIPRPKRLRLQKIDVVVAVIEKDGRILLQERPAGGLLAGLWEFPGGKVEPGETLPAALKREIREELGAGIRNVRHLTTVKHAYTRFEATLHVFSGRLESGELKKGLRRRWVTLRGMRRYPLPSGSVKIVEFLERRREREPMKSEKNL